MLMPYVYQIPFIMTAIITVAHKTEWLYIVWLLMQCCGFSSPAVENSRNCVSDRGKRREILQNLPSDLFATQFSFSLCVVVVVHKRRWRAKKKSPGRILSSRTSSNHILDSVPNRLTSLQLTRYWSAQTGERQRFKDWENIIIISPSKEEVNSSGSELWSEAIFTVIFYFIPVDTERQRCGSALIQPPPPTTAGCVCDPQAAIIDAG